MTPTECVKLVKFIDARCPAMAMRDETPEAWYIDLVGYDLTDALEAARRATLGRAFIGIGDLVRECEAIIQHRLGVEARARLDAQIAAENGGAVPEVVTKGPPLAIEGPLQARIGEYQAGRREAVVRQRTRAELAAERRAERKAAWDAKRAEIVAELDRMRERPPVKIDPEGAAT